MLPESSYSCSVILVPLLPVRRDAQKEWVRGIVAVMTDRWFTDLGYC